MDKVWTLCNDKGIYSRRYKSLNVYVPNNTISKYMRQKLIQLQRAINEFTI